MALADLTSREAVEAALDEFDRLGREAFLTRYGFGRARRYFIRRNSTYYDSKAIVGAALGYQYPDRGPMPASEFSGGEHGAKARLEVLGFEVVARPGLAAADTLPLQDALQAALKAQATRNLGEWSDDLQKAVAVTLPNAIREVVGQDFRVKGSAGFGNQAEIPWVSVMPPGLKGASEGRYVVYLFLTYQKVPSHLGRSSVYQAAQAAHGINPGPLRPDLVLQHDKNGETSWLLVEAKGGEHGVKRYARAAAFDLLAYRTAYAFALDGQRKPYGLGIAFGAGLAPASGEPLLLCTQDTITDALAAFFAG